MARARYQQATLGMAEFHRTIAEQQQARQELEKLIAGLSHSGQVTPTQGAFLRVAAAQNPDEAMRMVGGLLSPKDDARRIGESPLGKLFADLDIAEQDGNDVAVEALQTAIKQEIAPEEDGGPEINFDDVRAVRNDVIKNSEKFLEAQDAFSTLKSAAEQAASRPRSRRAQRVNQRA